MTWRHHRGRRRAGQAGSVGTSDPEVPPGGPLKAPEDPPEVARSWPVPPTDQEIAFEAMAVAPTAGGPALGNEVVLITHGAPGAPHTSGLDNSVVAGLRRAGPLAAAGLVANGANVIVTVLVARLLTERQYGALAELLSLFLIISMPGSALLVGVVRRVTSWQGAGQEGAVRRWTSRIHRIGVLGVLLLALGTFLARSAIAHAMSLPSSTGVVEVITAGGVWLLLSIDRGVLQARRSYVPLAGNLLVEGGVRTTLTIGLTAAGLGVGGAAGGILAAEVLAATQARWLTRSHQSPDRPPAPPPGAVPAAMTGIPAAIPAAIPATMPAAMPAAAPLQGRHQLLTDVSSALASLALLALLQNVDLIFVGRYNPAHSGAYAAISVASKALVFGGIALGSYLLPEAALRWHIGQHALRQLGATVLILAVPAAILLAVSIGAPDLLLRVVFGRDLASAASSFATLVGAMICLCGTVVMTNYLLGVGWRWIVVLLGLGTAAAAVLVVRAGGSFVATTRADLLVQGLLVAVVAAAFSWVHYRDRFRTAARQP